VTARPPALTATVSVLVAGLLAMAACNGSTTRRLIPPPPNTIAPITTAPPGSDFSGVALAPVEGRPEVEPVEVTGGEAVLSGVILGPDGPVAGATVRLERFVGDAIGKLDVVSNADGTWRAPQGVAPPPIATVPTTGPTVPGQLPTIAPPTTAPPPPQVTRPPVGPQGILGGRYRVRAWRTPDLALTAPQILFVEGKQNRTLGLQLARYSGTTVSSVSSPDPPVLDAPLTVTAVVSSAAVDGDGIVRALPLPNATVSLAVGAGLLFVGGPTFTNPQGRASFVLRCQALGASLVELTVNGAQTYSLPVRGCVPPAPTTTTSLPLDPGASTSSSIPGSGSSTSIVGTPTT